MKNKLIINEKMVIETGQAVKNLTEFEISQQSTNHLNITTTQAKLMTGAYIEKYSELKTSETELITSIGDALFEMQSFIIRAAKDMKEIDKKYAIR